MAMTYPIELSETYVIGFRTFDSDRRELAAHSNRVIDALLQGAPQESVAAALGELMERALHHFHNEEALMKSTYYPDADHHRGAHNELIRQIAELQGRHRRGTLDPHRALDFLRDWLLEHIAQVDVHYVQHFKRRGLV